MEQLKLADGTTFDLVPNGFNITPGLCIIKIKTELPLENIHQVFSNKTNTKVLKVLEGNKVTQMATDFTKINPTLRKSYGVEIIPATQETKERDMKGEDGQPVLDEQGIPIKEPYTVDVPAVIGDVAEVILEQAGLADQVDQNSADIDYLAIMSNVEL